MEKILILIFIFIIGCSNQSRNIASTKSYLILGFENQIDLSDPAGNKLFNFYLNQMIELSQKDQRPANGNWPIYFLENKEISNKKLNKILNIMLEKSESLENNFQPEIAKEILEIHRSLELNLIPPVKPKYKINEVMRTYIKDYFYTPALHGTNKATNIDHLGNPVDQSFWSIEKDIEHKNLNLGFNRNSIYPLENQICNYDEPKTGYGTKPGFSIKCGDKKLKIKFKEVHSEPFASRIFWSLGYNVEPVDYAKKVSLKYNRKILKEFNSRKELSVKITFGNKEISNKRYGSYYNPVDFIDSLLLKDGSHIKQNQLRSFLFKNPNLEKAEQEDSNYLNEDKIDLIIFKEVQFQINNEHFTKIGPWSFNELDHHTRREMRALVLLAAWLNWYDVRFDNNRLILDQQNNLKFFINDVGGCLGKIEREARLRQNSIEDLKNFSDRFTKRKLGKFQFIQYRTLDDNETFSQSDIEDLKWLGEKMLKLTPKQIEDALKASGFSNTEIEGFKVKLIKRLEFLKQDLYE